MSNSRNFSGSTSEQSKSPSRDFTVTTFPSSADFCHICLLHKVFLPAKGVSNSPQEPNCNFSQKEGQTYS